MYVYIYIHCIYIYVYIRCQMITLLSFITYNSDNLSENICTCRSLLLNIITLTVMYIE